MTDITTRFRDWMDTRRLTAADVCGDLHVSEQSIHNWRSAGVPARRAPHVERFMAEWVDPAVAEAGKEEVLEALRSEGVQNLVIQPNEEQFDNWTAAFKASKYTTLHEWAVAGLEAFAKEAEQQKTIAFPSSSRVAEDYRSGSTLPFVLPMRGRIAAGGRISADVVETELPVSKQYPAGCYALKVVGHSMEPEIPDEATIIVKPWKDGYPKKGTVVVYNDGHGVTLKVYQTVNSDETDDSGRAGKKPVLLSINPAFAEVEPMDGGRIVATLVEVL